MRSFVLALVLLFTPSLVLAQHPATVGELKPGPEIRVLWDKVVACAGPLRDTTRTYEEIHWLARDTVYYDGSPLLGEWVAPDTIYLTVTPAHEEEQRFEGWVIAHEMLHHAINGLREGDPVTGDPHPLNPFMFPCQLMAFQQVAGGMGGGTPLPSKYNSSSFTGGK